jgi:hypothetical protein
MKNWPLILIIVIVILFIGSYFAFNNEEGMSLERICYTRESDGAKICIKGDSSCTFYPDGTTKCTQGKRVCSEFTNCASCTDPNNKPLGGSCYWNNIESKCGSKLQQGYSPSCIKPVVGWLNSYMPQYNTPQYNNTPQSYIPIVSLLPTTGLTNAAPINSYLL